MTTGREDSDIAMSGHRYRDRTMTDYETRTTRIVVLPKGEALFCERATTIEIDDESGGEFLVISQCSDHNEGKVKIDRAEWPHIRAAIDRLAGECRT